MKPVLVLRHSPHEALGNLAVALRAAGLELRVVNCFAEDWPQFAAEGFSPPDYSGLVVMGGPMNVDQTEEYPFLHTEAGWLRQAVEAELPTLGVCLGAQLLAKALGARVRANPVKEIGWYEIELLPEARSEGLMAGSRSRETVFHWHGDTFDLPAGAVHLARGSTCPQQAFRYGQRAYGVQFHPEITAEMVAHWLAAPSACALLSELDYIDADAIRHRTPEALKAMRPFSGRLFSGFARLCGAAAS